MSEQLVQLIADMEEEQAVALIKQMLDQGATRSAILEDCRAAMEDRRPSGSRRASTSSPS